MELQYQAKNRPKNRPNIDQKNGQKTSKESVKESAEKDFEDGSFASPDVQITMCVVFSGKVI